jgi:uncharacterized protein YjiS (DUF1127 family)
MFPQIITPTRLYPCNPRRYATGRKRWAPLPARITRLVAAAAIRGYRARHAMRRLMAFDDRLLRDMGVGRGEIERVVHSGRHS